jgi:ADP-ribose pyrophosphatase YjhB (NUDIX family)
VLSREAEHGVLDGQILIQDTAMDYWHRIRQAVGTESIIVPAAAGAIMQDGKILLVRHSQLKKWQIPGGVHEPGESIQDTVQREITEELGLTLRARDLVAIYSGPKWMIEYPDGNHIQQLLFFFLMEGRVDQIRLQETEVTAYRFFQLDEIPDDTMECCKQKAADLKRYEGRTLFR